MLFYQYTLVLFLIIFLNKIHGAVINGDASAMLEIQRLENELIKDEEQFRIDLNNFQKEKQFYNVIKPNDVIRLNVGGNIIMTIRQTLTKASKSILYLLFNGQSDEKLPFDKNGNVYLDFNSEVFRYLLNQLRTFGINNINSISPPSDPLLIIPFKKLLKKLNLNSLLTSVQNHVITYNFDGDLITSQYKTVNPSTDIVITALNSVNDNDKTNLFLDYSSTLFTNLTYQLREKTSNNLVPLKSPMGKEKISFHRMLIDLSTQQLYPDLTLNKLWRQDAVTIAGGHGEGEEANQIDSPYGFHILADQTIFIADHYNDRVVKWGSNANEGSAVAGDNGEGNGLDQLNRLIDVVIDTKRDSLIICDRGNRRVVEWARVNGQQGQVLLSDIACWGVALDKNGHLYVSDTENHEVKRYKIGETDGVIVAGGNGQGTRFNQFNEPTYLYIDQDDTVYATDWGNDRIMKWTKGATEGILIAGGNGQGSQTNQLSYPGGITFDHQGNVYVSDSGNHRIICWLKGAKQGIIIAGGNGEGDRSNQLNTPEGLAFDYENNLVVADWGNNRIQKFITNLI